jgi:nicotinamide-nucleotide amidase
MSTGTELMQGLYADTNAQYLSQVMEELGFDVRYHTAVGDNAKILEEALRIARTRVEIVVISGGLGPTADDITRNVVARVWVKKLQEDKEALRLLERRFASRELKMPPSNRVQTLVPKGAVALHNPVGTATGFIVKDKHTMAVVLPGPKREFVPMLEKRVIPFLTKTYGVQELQRTRTIRTFGVPESYLNEQLRDLFSKNKKVDLAFLAKPGKVDIRLNARGESNTEIQQCLTQIEREILRRIGEEHVYGYDEEEIEQNVGRLLKERSLRVAVAESCTGGGVTMRLTEVSGSSNYISECYVTYSNEAKMKLLGVKPETLKAYGAVSRETAAEMAAGVRERAGVDIGLGITGIAGPTGGTAEKPVGLTYFGLADARRVMTFQRKFTGNRSENRLWATETALDLLRRLILGKLAEEK